MSNRTPDPAPAPHGSAPSGTQVETSGGAAPGSVRRDRRATDAADRAGRPRPTDRLLNLLLLEAERNGRTGLTVCVGPIIVSGTLIGTLAYCGALADRFASSTGGTDMHEAFADSFRGLVDDAHGIARGDRRAPADPAAYEQAAEFLHLADARYVTPSGFLPPGRSGILWRCRVADVTGWSLGDLTVPAFT